MVALGEPHQWHLQEVRRPDRSVLERPDDPDGLLDGLLGELGLLRWKPEEGGVLEVGDAEHGWAVLRQDNGPHRLDKIDRGVRGTVARFSDQAVAYAYLVLVLAEAVRTQRGWPAIFHRQLAPRAQLTEAPEGQRLTWPGGWALLAPGWLGEEHAHQFSWAAQVRLAEIVESYRDHNGRPLFDLGLPDDPRAPRPVETPPPDPTAAAETAVVLEAAAEISWGTWPTEAGDVLAVADQQGTGRVISYRRGMFLYSSLAAGRYRKVRGTFATAGAARRFLLLEMSTIARSWRYQPVLRVHRAAPNWAVTTTPTELIAEGNGLRATFPLGPADQQRGLLFTFCANARLEDIVASFRDPGGAPLLALGR